MSKAPAPAEPRKNPYITQGIGKHLLTPCRQVGLSRKRKAPTGANVGSSGSSADLSGHQAGNLVVTPLASNSARENARDGKKKGKVSKRLMPMDGERVLGFDDVDMARNSICFLSPLTHMAVNEIEIALKAEYSKASLNTENMSKKKSEIEEKKRKKTSSKIDGVKESANIKDSAVVDLTTTDEEKCSEEIGKIITPKKNSKKMAVGCSDEEVTVNVSDLKAQMIPEVKTNAAKIDSLKDVDSKPLKNGVVNKNKRNAPRETKDATLGVGFSCDKNINHNRGGTEAETITGEVAPSEKLKTIKAKKNDRKNITESSDEEDIPLSDLKMKVETNTKKIASVDMEDSDINALKKSEFGKNKKNVVKETTAGLAADFDCHKDVSIDGGVETENDSDRKISDTKEKKISEATTSRVLGINDEKTTPKVKASTKKIKRSLSLKKSNADFKDDATDYSVAKECSISLSRSEGASPDGNLPKPLPGASSADVRDLERQIKQKRKLVEDLKRAETYKKKHDLDELAALTAVWKKGCISALNDLLPQLQTHAAIDMATLLKNLNIPREVVAVAEDGQLI